MAGLNSCQDKAIPPEEFEDMTWIQLILREEAAIDEVDSSHVKFHVGETYYKADVIDFTLTNVKFDDNR